jgi:hypothetical protein
MARDDRLGGPRGTGGRIPTRPSPSYRAWPLIPLPKKTAPKMGTRGPSWPVAVAGRDPVDQCWRYRLGLLTGEGLRGLRSRMGRA